VDGGDDHAARIATQVVENDHRAAITTADRVAAFEQMALLGVSAAQIAKRTGHQRAQVDAALVVAKSPVAVKATAEHGLTIDQAAIIAEFADDPQAVDALTETATTSPEALAHHAERRTLIANNKAWTSAETVRRAWLGSFAARKTTPKDAAAFAAARLVDSAGVLDAGGHQIARVPTYGEPDALAALVAASSPARASHLTLVMVLCAIEWVLYPAQMDGHTLDVTR
jgi:hypothetical protein